MEKGVNHCVSQEELLIQSSKFGDTMYYLNHFDISIDPIIFIPKSVINQTRRDAIEQLQAQILNVKTIEVKSQNPSYILSKFSPSNLQLMVRVSNLEQLQVAINNNIVFIVNTSKLKLISYLLT